MDQIYLAIYPRVYKNITYLFTCLQTGFQEKFVKNLMFYLM
jgi:hypothetical protein